MKSRFLNAAVLALACLASPMAEAQTFPQRPIRIIVPYGAGGSPDVLSRLFGQKLSESLGQPVIIDNRPGASGIIAAELAAKAPADGYTLFIADTGHLAINPALRPNLPYEPLRDFAPITLAVSVPLYLLVNNSVPVSTVGELIALSKTRDLLYGSAGNGSPHHLAMEFFKSLTGAKLTHVPYKGNAQMVPAVLAGDVAVLMTGLTAVRSHMEAGKLRVLAMTSGKRSPITPDVPTIAESVSGYEASDIIGFLAPAATPRDIVAKLNAEFVKLLAQADVRQRVAGFAMEVVGSTPEQYAEAIRDKQQRYSALAKAVGLRVD